MWKATQFDFAFIDGLHTEAQQALDFEAIFPYAAPDAVFVFHDVINWKMEAGFKRLLSVTPPRKMPPPAHIGMRCCCIGRPVEWA